MSTVSVSKMFQMKFVESGDTYRPNKGRYLASDCLEEYIKSYFAFV